MRGDLNRLSPRRLTGFSVEEDLGIHGMLVGGPNGRPPNENEIGFPTINIQGFNGFGDNVGGEGIDLSQTYQLVDNLTLIRGSHALKIGGDVRRLLGDATSTNAPFGALDFTRDITGHAAGSLHDGLSEDVAHARGHSYRRNPSMAHRVLRAGRLAGDAATDRQPRSPLRPQLRAEGHQWCQPDAAVRPRSERSRSLAWSRRSGRPAVSTSTVTGRRVLDSRAEQPAGRPGGIRRLQHGSAPGQHQYAWHQSSDRQRAGHQPDNESAGDDCFPFPPAPHSPTRSSTSPRRRSIAITRMATTRTGTSRSATSCPAAVVEVRYVGSKGSDLDTSLTNFNSPDPDPNAGGIRSSHGVHTRVRPNPNVGNRRRERLSLAPDRASTEAPGGCICRPPTRCPS